MSIYQTCNILSRSQEIICKARGGLTLEVLQFLISLSLSSLGVLFDLLTTNIFVKEIGLKFEWNKFVTAIVSRWGYKVWIFFVEFPVVLFFAFFDSSFSLVFHLGLVWLIGRGFVASENLRAIVQYRMIGIEEFKAQYSLREEALRNSSLGDKLKLKLPYLIGLTISGTIFLSFMFPTPSSLPLLNTLSLGLIFIFLKKIVV